MELIHLQTPTVKVTEKYTFIHVQENRDDQKDDDCFATFARRPRASSAPPESLRSCCDASKANICDDGCRDSTDYDSLGARSTCSWTSEAGDDEAASEHSSACSSSLVDSAAGVQSYDIVDVPYAAHLSHADMEWAPAMFHPSFLATAAEGYNSASCESYTDFHEFALVCFVCPEQGTDAQSWVGANMQQGGGANAAVRRDRRKVNVAKNRRAGVRNSMGRGSSTIMKGTREAGAVETDMSTTVNLKNLPDNCTLSNVLDTLDREGFSGYYNFVHVPANFATKAHLGYAQVNLLDHALSELFCQHFQGFNNWAGFANSCEPSGCNADWTVATQGLEALIERYRNSPLMHESVPDEYKPALFSYGQRINFPGPTARLKAPRMRHSKQCDRIGEDEA